MFWHAVSLHGQVVSSECVAAQQDSECQQGASGRAVLGFAADDLVTVRPESFTEVPASHQQCPKQQL